VINKILWTAVLLVLVWGCKRGASENIVASAGQRQLTREGFAAWCGMPYDSLSADERQTQLNGWLEQAMIEQEAEAVGLQKDPQVMRTEREILAQYYRATMLARLPSPEITDSLINDYYSAHQIEFRRPIDSYLIEGFWCESDDTLKMYRRALEHADTSRLRSDYVVWEGKWLSDARELEPELLSAVRALKPGGVTPVMPFGEGYRLLRLHEIYPEGAQLSVDAVRQEIRERLLTEQSQRRQERWETELRGRYAPRIMDNTK